MQIAWRCGRWKLKLLDRTLNSFMFFFVFCFFCFVFCFLFVFSYKYYAAFCECKLGDYMLTELPLPVLVSATLLLYKDFSFMMRL